MNAATKRVIFAVATLAAGFSAQRVCRSYLNPAAGTGTSPARTETVAQPQGHPSSAGSRPSLSALALKDASLSGIARFLVEYPAPLDREQFASYFRDHIEPQPPETRRLLVKYIFAGLGADHLDSGIDLTGEIPDSGLKLLALKALAENCRPAPETAIPLLGECDSFDQRREIWVALVGAIPCRDPKEHFETASGLSAAIKSLLPEAGSMELLAGGIARHWARKDPMAAWEFGGNGNDLPSILLRKEAFAALSRSRPEVALGLIRQTKLPDSTGEKEYYLSEVYTVIFKSGATILASDIAMEDLKLPQVAAGIRSAMGKWSSAQIDQFFARNPDLVSQPLFKEFYLKHALIAGGDQLAKLLEDGGLKDLGKMNLGLFSLSEPPDPRSLAMLLGTSGVSQHLENGVESIAWRDLAARDLDLAIATADAMEDKEAAKRALQNIIAEVGKEDPAKGVEMIASRNLPPKDRDALIGKLVVTWSQRDLGGALAWADSLDAGAGKLAALSSMIGAVRSFRQRSQHPWRRGCQGFPHRSGSLGEFRESGDGPARRLGLGGLASE